MVEAYSPDLEYQILKLSAPLGVTFCTDDPITPEDMRAHFESTGRIRVWTGASDHTIWSSPEVNWRFRAWHDSLHLQLGAGFDVKGEMRVTQASLAKLESGQGPRAVLWAELWGQFCYQGIWGEHPVNQRRFVERYVEGSADSALSNSPQFYRQ